MAGYLGAVPVPQATQHRDTFTATDGQTTFNVQPYTPTFLDVYLNGVRLNAADVTATNGTSVVLVACETDDIVDVISYTAFEVGSLSANSVDSDQYVDGSIDTVHIADANVTQAKIADQAINEAKLQVSNAPTNGYALTAQSGNTGGMTWAEVGGGSMVFIASSGAINDAASVAFTGFDAGAYDSYVFMLHAVVPVVNSVKLYCQVSTNGGTSYSTSSGDYHEGDSGNTVGLNASYLEAGDKDNNSLNFGITGPFELFNVGSSALFTTSLAKPMIVQAGGDAAGANMNIAYGHRNSISHRYAVETNNAVRFIFHSGNIDSGEIVMYGIANA
mgnify:CR=1 FL=1